MKNILFVYLHGFNSSGQSLKARQLQTALPGFEWLTPSYPPVPDQAVTYLIDCLRSHCSQQHIPVFIGSSLGGYYAQYLSQQFDARNVLINPALDPVTTLRPYLGKQINYHTREEYYFGENELGMFKKYDVESPCEMKTPTLLLLDEGDEIIPYQWALEKYEPCSECHVFPGGDHNFQHLQESVELILNFVKQ